MAKNSNKKISQEQQEIVLKEKRKRTIIAGSVFAVLIGAWLIFAIVDDAISRKVASQTDVNFNSIIEYMEGLSE